MSRHEVTDLLAALQGGDTKAADRLFGLVHRELRDVAHRQLAGEREGHTLNPTALVNELYVKWEGWPPRLKWSDRNHFFAVAARAMRQILVDYARRRRRAKRGGGVPLVTFDPELPFTETVNDELLALDEALTRLQSLSPRQVKVVECRFFAGMPIRETADALQISVPTANRDWAAARLWLKREMSSILRAPGTA